MRMQLPCFIVRQTTRTSKASGADRKSTRLNSSHVRISYAVFCLKKKNKNSVGPARSEGERVDGLQLSGELNKVVLTSALGMAVAVGQYRQRTVRADHESLQEDA